MNNVAQTPEAARAKATATLKAREDAIRANAIGQGRKLERAEIMQALGVQRLEEASQIATLRQERDARPTPDAEHKHAVGNRWRGRVEGMIIGGLLIAAAIFAMQGVIWDTAARSFREQAMTGAMLSSQGEREPEAAFTERGSP